MNPGCIVRDPKGRLGRLVSTEGTMGTVASLEAPDTPGSLLNRRLEVYPLAELSEVSGPVRVVLADGSTWETQAIAIPRA